MRLCQQIVAVAVTTCVSAAMLVSPVGAQSPTPQPGYDRLPPHALQPTSTQTQRRPRVFHHATVEQAWQSAAMRQRPLLVMITSDNCRYCTKMLNETYGHPVIQNLLAAHTETVLAHADVNKALTERLHVRAYPTSLIVSPQGEIVAAIEGYVDPQAFVQRVAPLLLHGRQPFVPAVASDSAQHVAANAGR